MDCKKCNAALSFISKKVTTPEGYEIVTPMMSVVDPNSVQVEVTCTECWTGHSMYYGGGNLVNWYES